VSQSGDAYPDGPGWDDVDWLDVNSSAGGAAPPRRPWPRWLTLAVLGAVVAVALIVVNVERRAPSAARSRPTPSASSIPSASSSPAPSSLPAPPETAVAVPVPPAGPAVSVTKLGHPLLDASSGWELFGRADQTLFRIQPAAGRITRTTVPGLLSNGPVFLVAGSDRVIIRPLERVPAYVVRDGQPTRRLPLSLSQEGPVFPGPTSDQMWVLPADAYQPVLALATLEGKRLAGFISVPQESSPLEAAPDGAGYVLVPGTGGLYDARPEGLHRISTGSLLAVGPTGWLVLECDDRHRCKPVLVSRTDRARRVVNAAAPPPGTSGMISPDGATAAMIAPAPNGTMGLFLLDLASGRRRVLDLSVNQASYYGAAAFSPDSKWLFVVTADGSLAVINPKTGSVGSLGAPLPPLTQLLVRPVGSG
jgi:hypothetical protein